MADRETKEDPAGRARAGLDGLMEGLRSPVSDEARAGYDVSAKEARDPRVPPRRGRIRTLVIEEVANGFLVTIGCQRFVFAGDSLQERAEFTRKLQSYIMQPHQTEDDWSRAHEGGPAPDWRTDEYSLDKRTVSFSRVGMPEPFKAEPFEVQGPRPEHEPPPASGYERGGTTPPTILR